MISIQGLAGIAAALLIASSIPAYIASIIQGQTRPARATYAIKSVVAAIVFASYVAANGLQGAWTLFALALSALTIFCLSLHYGVGGFDRVDVVSAAIAAIAIVTWYATSHAELGLGLGMLTKWVALIPTLAKLRRLPGSESKLSWLLALGGDSLNVLACPRSASALLPAVNEVLLSAAVILQLRNGGARTHQTMSSRAKGAHAGIDIRFDETKPAGTQTRSR